MVGIYPLYTPPPERGGPGAGILGGGNPPPPEIRPKTLPPKNTFIKMHPPVEKSGISGGGHLGGVPGGALGGRWTPAQTLGGNVGYKLYDILMSRTFDPKYIKYIY